MSIGLYKPIVRPIVFLPKDPETAHIRTRFLFDHPFPLNLLRRYSDYAKDRLSFQIDGVRLDGPIGNAAGLDKDCEMLPGLAQLFDYVTVGTLLPYAWDGWQRPRIARNVRKRSLVNKMGFPFKGPDYSIERLEQYDGDASINASVSVRPLESEDQFPALQQFYTLFRRVSLIYKVKMREINFASPNTSGLAGFFEERTFEGIAKTTNNIVQGKPTFLKLPPYTNDSTRDRNLTLIDIWQRYGGRG